MVLLSGTNRGAVGSSDSLAGVPDTVPVASLRAMRWCAIYVTLATVCVRGDGLPPASELELRGDARLEMRLIAGPCQDHNTGAYREQAEDQEEERQGTEYESRLFGLGSWR